MINQIVWEAIILYLYCHIRCKEVPFGKPHFWSTLFCTVPGSRSQTHVQTVATKFWHVQTFQSKTRHVQTLATKTWHFQTFPTMMIRRDNNVITSNLSVAVPTFVTKITEYLCSWWFFFQISAWDKSFWIM